MIVDAVLEVVAIPADEISEVPKMFRGLKAEYLRGLIRREDGLIDLPRRAAPAQLEREGSS